MICFFKWLFKQFVIFQPTNFTTFVPEYGGKHKVQGELVLDPQRSGSKNYTAQRNQAKIIQGKLPESWKTNTADAT